MNLKELKRSSWLGYLNFYILQWFCIRLGRVGKFENDEFVQTGWTIVRYIFPLTGWWSDYRWIKKVQT